MAERPEVRTVLGEVPNEIFDELFLLSDMEGNARMPQSAKGKDVWNLAAGLKYQPADWLEFRRSEPSTAHLQRAARRMDRLHHAHNVDQFSTGSNLAGIDSSEVEVYRLKELFRRSKYGLFGRYLILLGHWSEFPPDETLNETTSYLQPEWEVQLIQNFFDSLKDRAPEKLRMSGRLLKAANTIESATKSDEGKLLAQMHRYALTGHEGRDRFRESIINNPAFANHKRLLSRLDQGKAGVNIPERLFLIHIGNSLARDLLPTFGFPVTRRLTRARRAPSK